jgi:hypothetical protein
VVVVERRQVLAVSERKADNDDDDDNDEFVQMVNNDKNSISGEIRQEKILTLIAIVC